MASITAPSHPYEGTKITPSCDARAINNYHITSQQDLEQVYFSLTVYNEAFEEILDMKSFFTTSLASGGMQFIRADGWLILETILKGTPCAKIRNWWSRLKGAWLIYINGSPVSNVADVNSALNKSLHLGNPDCMLLFSHPENRCNLTNEGIPQITLDQLNPQLGGPVQEFLPFDFFPGGNHFL